MARPKKSRAPEDIDAPEGGIDHEGLEAAGQALAERGQAIALVDAQFGSDLPYDLNSYIARIRQNAAESAMRLIDIGRMLIQIRERESREDFVDAIERTGMSPRFAQRSMQAAIKLHDRPMLQKLGVSKALEFLSEDDDTLDDLEAGGTLAGRTFDELDQMSVRELKEALRAERRDRADEKEADEDIIRRKDERINKLTRDKRKRSSESEIRAKADELLRDADNAAVEATSQIARLKEICADVDALYADAGLALDADIAERLEVNAQWASNQLGELAEYLGE